MSDPPYLSEVFFCLANVSSETDRMFVRLIMALSRSVILNRPVRESSLRGMCSAPSPLLCEGLIGWRGPLIMLACFPRGKRKLYFSPGIKTHTATTKKGKRLNITSLRYFYSASLRSCLSVFIATFCFVYNVAKIDS